MSIAESAYINQIREQLLVRKQNLQTALHRHETSQMQHLLHDVDHALAKLEDGDFGVCENCHESIEVDRVIADPLVTFCLSCLSPAERSALEHDLALAARMQNCQLPGELPVADGWDTAYHFQPARIVSGDYFDLICDNAGGLFFVLADVAGKGISAAMLTASLRAVFRALIPTAECVGMLLEKANRLFCESAMSGQYATLVFGHVKSNGEVELANAGHLPVLLARETGVEILESTDLPFGMFCNQQFTVQRTNLQPRDTLVLYTDGISEAQNATGEEFGLQQLREFISAEKLRVPCEVVRNCRELLEKFRGGVERNDDETLLAIQFAPAARATQPELRAYA